MTALSYADAGLAVLPLKPRSKVPAGSLVPHGVKDATTDSNKIQAWADRLPEANIGIATGACSGVFVLDVDPRTGGNEALAEYESLHGLLPSTVFVETGRGDGGRHLYCSCPKHPVRNVHIGRGMDVKGDGGYVVAPCSIHPSGHAYAGELDRPRIAVASDWLLALLRTEAPEDTSRTQALHVSASDCDPKELV